MSWLSLLITEEQNFCQWGVAKKNNEKTRIRWNDNKPITDLEQTLRFPES
jgi:hypothetical protein